MKKRSPVGHKDLKKKTVLLICICLAFFCICLFPSNPEESAADTNISAPASAGTDEVFEMPGETEETISSDISLEDMPSEPEVPSESPGAEHTPPDLTVSCAKLSPSDLAPYSGSASIAINGNVPYFSEGDLLQTASFEFYNPLDSLGRCGVVYACIGRDLMPTEARGEIGQIKPSGWHTVKYNGVIDQNYLYNRCHLIGYQLTGNNADARNLITGTRFLNVEGMLPLENRVADYIKESGNHVLYRVTPLFEGDNLLASGVLMEARSLEDDGEGVEFCVYCYNVQPNILIDYADGSSRLDENLSAAREPSAEPSVQPSQTPSAEPSTAPSAKPSPTPSVKPSTEPSAKPLPEPSLTPAPSETSTPLPEPSEQPNMGKYAVNAKNGKIHITGKCPATGDGKNAMTQPVYFDTYEEAEAYSIQNSPGQSKRKCGNCF